MSEADRRRGDRWILAGLLILALALRLIRVFITYVISEDGVHLIQLAKLIESDTVFVILINGQHPLYSILTVGMHWLIPEWELAGQMVSALMGIAALVPIYFITRRIFGSRVAWIAGLIYLFHPYLCRNSSKVLTDTTYIFFIVCSAWVALIALERRHMGWYALVGVLGGLAYLTRPEGVGIIIVVGLWCLVAPVASFKSNYVRRILSAVILAGAFFVIAFPYIFHISMAQGEWRFTLKWHLIRTLTRGRWDGEEFFRIRAPGDFGDRTAEVDRKEDEQTVAARRNLKQKARVKEGDVVGTVIKAYHHMLFIFLFVGIFKRRWVPYKPRGELFLASVCVLYIVVLFFLVWEKGYISKRHVLPVVALSICWSAVGINELASPIYRVGRWIRRRGKGAVPETGVRNVLVAFMLIIVVVLAVKGMKPYGVDKLYLKHTGVWIEENTPETSVVAGSGLRRIGFYAQRAFVEMPALDDQEDIIEYARQWNADMIVVRDRELSVDDTGDALSLMHEVADEHATIRVYGLGASN